MSLETHDFTYKGERSVLMACAVGFGHQPILCNIIGSEPLFYIEEDYALDEALFEDIEIEGAVTAQSDFFSLKEQDADRLERLRKTMTLIERDRAFSVLRALEGDKALLQGDQALPVLTLSEILDFASKSGALSQAMAFAISCGIDFKTSAQVETVAYDRDGRTVLVNPHQTLDQAALHMARALRMVDHHQAGILIHPLLFDPEQAVLINRVMEADATLASIRAAWDLRLAGEKTAWTHLVTGPAYDLASAFAREAITDFRSITDGRAARATFEQWFLSSRCKAADRHLIQTMLADHHGYVFDTENFTKHLTKDVLARIGDSHQGQNYLSSILDVVLSDPLYNEIRDRSNANFLWFIKFERSFRESEDALGMAESKSVDTATQADIIRMADHRPLGSGTKNAGSPGDESATIYYLNHFVGLY